MLIIKSPAQKSYALGGAVIFLAAHLYRLPKDHPRRLAMLDHEKHHIYRERGCVRQWRYGPGAWKRSPVILWPLYALLYHALWLLHGPFRAQEELGGARAMIHNAVARDGEVNLEVRAMIVYDLVHLYGIIQREQDAVGFVRAEEVRARTILARLDKGKR